MQTTSPRFPHLSAEQEVEFMRSGTLPSWSTRQPGGQVTVDVFNQDLCLRPKSDLYQSRVLLGVGMGGWRSRVGERGWRCNSLKTSVGKGN